MANVGSLDHSSASAHARSARPDMTATDFTPVPEATIEGDTAKTATQLRRECAGYIAALGLGFEPSIVLEEGRPVEVLQRAVSRLTPDLVVIGTRGQGALGRAVLGSTAEEALRSLECDVLAVPPAAE